MKRLIVPLLLAALTGCGDDSSKGPEKREFKVKAAPKDTTQEDLKRQNAQLQKKLAEDEARMNAMMDLVTEVKQKQDQADEVIQLAKSIQTKDKKEGN